jgi:uroporphyrin-3 C-methyltransferase
MDDTAPPSPLPTGPVAAPPRRASPLLWIIALALIAAATTVLWWQTTTSNSAVAGANAEMQRLNAHVDALTHTVAQLHGNADTLRARLDDGDKVDKSAREQLLGLAERARLLEDAIANLADKRLSGHDALALDEAEMLLTLGAERYALFHEAAAAIAAYRLADTALSEVEDAAFSTVRQSIVAEIAALDALPKANPGLLSAQLAQLRTQLAQLPVVVQMPQPSAPAQTSRLWRVLGAFVQVHHGDDAPAQVALHDAGLARELAVLDLREAESALLARDATRYRDALAAARAQLTAVFDPHAPAVAAALSQLEAMSRAELAPPLPAILGTALKQLRNLRTTHALHAPATPKSDEAQK